MATAHALLAINVTEHNILCKILLITEIYGIAVASYRHVIVLLFSL